MLVRKIGDVFEYKGEKYQVSKCLKDTVESCDGCAFKPEEGLFCRPPDNGGACSEYGKSRDEDVIFIKLEKN